MFLRRLTGFTLAVICLLASSCAERADIKKQVFKKDPVEELVASSEKANRHVVKKDETIEGIAAKHGVSAADIRKANKMGHDEAVKPGMRLVIPAKPRTEKEEMAKAKGPPEEPPPAHMNGKFIWPVKPVSIGSGFGVRNDSKHDGIDLRGEKGVPIVASAEGKIIFSGSGPSGYGKMVIVKHDSRTITIYAHNEENLVSEGQEVKQGEKIATVGRSGRADGYHCHFEMRIDRKPIDPAKYLPEPK